MEVAETRRLRTTTIAPDETLSGTSMVTVEGGPKGTSNLTVSAADGSGASTAAA